MYVVQKIIRYNYWSIDCIFHKLVLQQVKVLGNRNGFFCSHKTECKKNGEIFARLHVISMVIKETTSSDAFGDV